MVLDPLLLEPLWPGLSWLSYRVVAVCLASVPATHALGLYLHAPKALLRVQNTLLFPLTGGNRHIVFQILAWSMWWVSALTVLPLVVSPHHLPLPTIPNSHVDVVSGAAASFSFIGELFMLKAMLVYDNSKQPDVQRRKGLFASPSYSAAAAIIMGSLLSMTGILHLAMLEYMPDMPSRVLYCCLSLSCLTIGASTTYGLGGFLRYMKGAAGSADWNFFQPFTGGTAFVATQAVAWSMFSVTVVCMVWVLQQVVAGMAFCIRCWVLSCGIMMICTQLVLALSVLLFKGRASAGQVMLRPPVLTYIIHLFNMNAPMVLMFLPAHTLFAVWTLSFTFMPFSWALGVWTALLIPYYALTNFNEPQHTGSRTWPPLRAWLARHIQPCLDSWFEKVELIYAGGDKPLDPNEKHVFGYHPHGWYPTGAGYLPLLPAWKSLFPGVSPVTLVASIIFVPPSIRDFAAWLGFRQVTRKTFVQVLKQEGNAILCPGGQAEMVHSWRAFKPEPEFVLHCRHKGFIRIALQQGANLVPLLSLGELLQLRNLINAPAMQQYTYRRFGFPMPFVMAGRWGVSPLPRQIPLVFVVGSPIKCPEDLAPGEDIPESVLNSVHAQYYNALAQLFEQHKHLHPDLKNAKLVLEHD